MSPEVWSSGVDWTVDWGLDSFGSKVVNRTGVVVLTGRPDF